MAKARAIVKRRKSVQNIRKITRTMELIATARFKKALDRATEAEAYTRKIAELVADLGATGGRRLAPAPGSPRAGQARSLLLVITSNRGLAGGYNGNVIRAATRAFQDFETDGTSTSRSKSPASGGSPSPSSGASRSTRPTPSSRTGRSSTRSRSLANKYIGMFLRGEIDRVDVAYTRFINSARQEAVVETLLPMTAAQVGESGPSVRQAKPAGRPTAAKPGRGERVPYEFVPDAAEHPGGDRPGLVQGPALQVLPRRRRQRADRPDGRHAGGDRERRRHDQDPHPALQPRPPGPDHPRAGRDHRRRRGARIMQELHPQMTQMTADGKMRGKNSRQSEFICVICGSVLCGRHLLEGTRSMATATATGRIAQVIGSTFDAEFDEGHLPEIYNALTVNAEEKGVTIDLTGEVQQHLGGNRVRCVALGSTDGLVRGMTVVDTGGPVQRAGRQGDAGPGVQPARQPDRRPGPGPRHRALADPPRPARVRPALAQDRGLRDRASRSSTCSPRSSAAARSASSAAPGWARR